MSSIDERIVEMKFNRADFLNGTDQTLSALERLESALVGGGGIGEGVQAIGQKMSVMGAVAFGALAKIGGMAVSAGASLVKNIMDPIFSGGKKRALNLEQANFQLMGILKDGDKVKAVMENVSTAVDGTAYGLDAAAVAAAQFAASGMVAGQEMENSLRGISGVAAMAGSSYEDVASIFTKVAGQGRLMGDDLNRLASRGINAAATLADWFEKTGKAAGLTEADIREMVSKGKISFADFSEAMNATFGDHATKANETYAGSLANIKSALGRIGAEYYIVEHEKLRRIFNAMRPAINTFKTALMPLFKLYERFYAIPMAEAFERFGAAAEKINWAPLVNRMGQLMTIGATFRVVVQSWIKPITDAFKAVTAKAPEGGWLSTTSNFLDAFSRGLLGLKATEGQAEKVQGAFEKFFTAIGKGAGYVKDAFWLLATGASFAWGLIKTGAGYVVTAFEYVKPVIMNVFDYLFGQEGKISKFWEAFKQKIEETGSVLETLGYFFKSFFDNNIMPFVESLKNFTNVLRTLKDDGLTGIKAKLETAFEPLLPIWEFVKKLIGGLKDSIAGVDSPFEWLRTNLSKIGQWFKDAFTGASDTVGGMEMNFDFALDGIALAIGAIARAIAFLFENVTIDDLIKMVDALGRLALIFLAFKTLKGVNDVLGSVSGAFGELGAMFGRIGKEKVSDKVLKIAIALGIMAGALWLLSKIPTDKLLIGAGVLVGLGAALLLFSLAIGAIDTTKFSATGVGLVLFAVALMGLVTALLLLGLIPMPTLIKGGIALAAMLILLTAAVAIMGHWAADFAKIGFGIGLMAAALTLLVIPIRTLGEMDINTLAQGFGTLMLLLIGLTIAAAVMGQNGDKMMLGAIGIALMAAALTLLIIPIEKLGAMDLGSLAKGVGALAILIIALVTAAAIAQKFQGGAISLIIIAGAIWIMAVAIEKLANVNFTDAIKGLLALGIALLLFIVAAAAAEAFALGAAIIVGLIIAIALAILAFGISAWLLSKAAENLVDVLPRLVDELKNLAENWDAVVVATPLLIALGIALGIFAIGAGLAGIAALLLGVGLTLMGTGMALMATFGGPGAKGLMTFVDALEPLWDKGGQLAAVAGVLALLGAGLIILGGGLLIAGAGAIVFGLGLIIMTTGLGLLFIAIYALSPLVDTVVEAIQKFIDIAGGIAALGGSLVVLGVGLGILGVGLVIAATGIVIATIALSAIIPFLLILIGLASTVAPIICAMLGGIAECLGFAADAVANIGGKIIDGFKLIGDGIKLAGEGIAAAVGNLVEGIKSALDKGPGLIADGVSRIIDEFKKLTGGIEREKIASTGSAGSWMIDLGSTLAAGAGPIGAGAAAAGQASSGVTVGINQNGSLATRAAASLGQRVASAIRSQSGSIYSAGFSTGTQAGAGMASGIMSKVGSIVSAASSLARSAVAATNRALQIQSPSRVFRKIGNFLVDGFLLPLRGRVGEAEKVSAKMATSTMDAFNEIVAGFNGEFDNLGMDFNPTITPVLDLGQVRSQARGMESLWETDASMAGGRNKAYALSKLEETLAGLKLDKQDETQAPKVEYNQYNTSPKALSEAEIYRQTKNLISTTQS